MQKPAMPPPGKFTTRWRLASAYSSACTAGCLPGYPGKKLARLPLVFTDEHGLPLVLHGFGAESYRDVAAKPGACGCPPQMHRDRHHGA